MENLEYYYEQHSDLLAYPEHAFYYAKYALKTHAEHLLETVLSSPHYAYEYALSVKGHDDRLLQAVLPHPNRSYFYAMKVLGRHDDRLLHAVLADPHWSYLYARNVLHAHDDRLLHAVLNDAENAYYYARYILHAHDARLYEAVILDAKYAVKYAASLLKRHDQRIFQLLMNNPYENLMMAYVSMLLKYRIYDKEVLLYLLNIAIPQHTALEQYIWKYSPLLQHHPQELSEVQATNLNNIALVEIEGLELPIFLI